MLILPHEKKQYQKRVFVSSWRREQLWVKVKVDSYLNHFSYNFDGEEMTRFLHSFYFFFLVHLTLMGALANKKKRTFVLKLRLEQKQTKSTLFLLFFEVRPFCWQKTKVATKQNILVTAENFLLSNKEKEDQLQSVGKGEKRDNECTMIEIVVLK